MFSLAFVVSFLVTLSLASPATMGRQTSACQSYGTPSQATFTLLAVSQSGITIQNPLVLGSDSLSSDGSTRLIGTELTMNQKFSTLFNMSDGRITSFTDSSITGVSKYIPQENGFLSFTRGEEITLPLAPSTGVYCILASTDPHGVEFPLTLAVNHSSNYNFSLCNRGDNNEVVVVYNAIESSSLSAGYNYSSCNQVVVVVRLVDQQ